MKTNTEIEIRKIRKQLKQYSNTEEEKKVLRDKLDALKKSLKKEKRGLIEDI